MKREYFCVVIINECLGFYDLKSNKRISVYFLDNFICNVELYSPS